jgi:hypothetical protein
MNSARPFFESLRRFCGAAAGATLVATSAQAGGMDRAPAPVSNQWSFQMTTYGWVSWLSGDVTVRGREFDVSLSPDQLINALDWSGIPVWMSYAEARKGKLSLFNDIMYSKVAGSRDFARGRDGAVIATGLSGTVEADNSMLILELGAAYEVWGSQSTGGATSIDLLGGLRYWRQEVEVSASVAAWVGGIGGLNVTGGRATARSGDVDWWDPFIGVRLRQAVAPGQNLTVRADIGGFDIGSQFTWHAIATYDARLLTRQGYAIDAYLGYKALSVDYSTGSGTSRYEYDVIQHGPVIGLTARF